MWDPCLVKTLIARSWYGFLNIQGMIWIPARIGLLGWFVDRETLGYWDGMRQLKLKVDTLWLTKINCGFQGSKVEFDWFPNSLKLLFPVCGGHLSATTTSAMIYSHARYGDTNYEPKEDCDWIIEAPQGEDMKYLLILDSLFVIWNFDIAFAGKNVHLSFQEFELEDESDCGYDFIEVFSGFDDSGSLHGRFCGIKVTVPPPSLNSKYFKMKSK